jgi:hypothetical protein
VLGTNNLLRCLKSRSKQILSAAALFQEQSDREGIIAMIYGTDPWDKIRAV